MGASVDDLAPSGALSSAGAGASLPPLPTIASEDEAASPSLSPPPSSSPAPAAAPGSPPGPGRDTVRELFPQGPDSSAVAAAPRPTSILDFLEEASDSQALAHVSSDGRRLVEAIGRYVDRGMDARLETYARAQETHMSSWMRHSDTLAERGISSPILGQNRQLWNREVPPVRPPIAIYGFP
jgi:hypothetical protein